MDRFKGKVAIVTGASLKPNGVGIGGATAVALAREGAHVVVGDLPQEGGGETLAEKIRADGGEATACPLDQGDEDSIAAIVDLTVRKYGGVDILVNNAALNIEEDTDLLSISAEVWDRIMAVNARGVFLLTKYAVPHMLKAGRGSIVNISSGSALAGDITRLAFGASKGAVNTFTQYIATMYGKQGIRCNAICPGLTMSAKAKDIIPPPALDIFLKQTLTPELGTPEQLAAAALFLASDDAGFVTGLIMSVDGGLLQHQTYSADFAALIAQAS